MSARRKTDPSRLFRRALERLEARDVPSFSIPELNSFPSATAQLYLDFDGHFEPVWGAYSNVSTPAYSVDTDTGSFSAEEIANIENIWARVAEDFAPFKINVTTVEPSVLAPGQPISAANGKALRVSIGGDGIWYQGGGSGGVGYINSFTSSIANVCYVFQNTSPGNTFRIANTSSHEAGHSFGLQHQSRYDSNGNQVLEYEFGNTFWAPLMGSAIYSTSVTTWHNGTSTSATTFQDDMALLARSANGFGYRTDDHGNTVNSATPLTVSGPNWSGAGVISTNTDLDFFSFSVTAADTFRISANVADIGPNLDAVIELRSSSGQLLETANPSDTQSATIVRSLAPGNYTVAVKSTGVYGWVGQYTLGIDRPPAGVTVTPATQHLSTREDGSTTSFTVALQTQPISNVTIPVSSSNLGEGTVSTSSLVFTPANWNVPQVVTITGIADGMLDGDVGYSVVLGAATSADAEYAGLDTADLAVINIDNDTAGYLYSSNGISDAIYRIRSSGSQPEMLIDLKATFGATTDFAPNGIAIDSQNGRLYWIDINTDTIYRADLDGSNPEIVHVTGSQVGRSLSVDVAGGKLYWIDTTAQTLRRANLDGSGVEDAASGFASSSRFVLDLTAGKVYWSETSQRTIRRANLDGTDTEVIWTGDAVTGSPDDLVIDFNNGKVYWTAGNRFIHRANLDGADVELIVEMPVSTIYIPNTLLIRPTQILSVSLFGDKLYWMENATQQVYRAELDGSNLAIMMLSENTRGIAGFLPNPGVTVTGRSGLVTTEAGGSAQFRVSLNTKPTSDVTIAVSSSDNSEGVPSTTLLTFTSENWNVTQTVTIQGVDDTDFDSNVGYTIVLSSSVSADPTYHGIDPADASVTNINDDFPTKFYVVDDASANRTYEYTDAGASVENYSLNSGNSSPRGAASTAAGTTVWVVDANKIVYVYNTSGSLLGSWTAGSLASNATVEGITVHGRDVWLVDARQDRVYRYANAATRMSGSQNASSNFSLNSSNKNPKDLVTDGVSIWVIEDNGTDKVFKYTLSGSLLGSWTIAGGGGSPTGLTLDPTNEQQHLWIVDASTDRVYQFDNSRSRTSGSQSAGTIFNLAAGNTNPQGIADPPTGAGAPSRDSSQIERLNERFDRIDLTTIADTDSEFDFRGRRERLRLRR